MTVKFSVATLLITCVVSSSPAWGYSLYSSDLEGSGNINWKKANSVEGDNIVEVKLPDGSAYYQFSYREGSNDYPVKTARDAPASTTSDETLSIKADYVGVQSEANGGALDLTSGTYDTVYSYFVNNSTSSQFGGAFYNGTTITSLKGNYIGNSVSGPDTAVAIHGGGQDNHGTINNIMGNFIANYAVGSGDETKVYGGALYNEGTISTISGDFVGNYITTKNTGYGGAIANTGHLGTISGDLVGNYVQTDSTSASNALGGAVYTTDSITFANGGEFTDNYIEWKESSDENAGYIKLFNFLHVNSLGKSEGDTGNPIIKFDTGSGSFTINDSITTSNNYSLYFSGRSSVYGLGNDEVLTSDDNPLSTTYYVKVNSDIVGANSVTVENTTLKFDKYTHKDTTAVNADGKGSFAAALNTDGTVNTSASSVTSLTLSDAIFHIANGYLENVYLNGYKSTNGYMYFDVDPTNMVADVLNVTGNVIGTTGVIVKALSTEDIGEGSILFATSTNDSKGSDSSFAVVRVIGSPYYWKVLYEEIPASTPTVADADDSDSDEGDTTTPVTKNWYFAKDTSITTEEPTDPDEGNGDEGNGDEGNGDEGNGDEGNGDEGNGDEGNGDEGNGDEGNGDEGNGDDDEIQIEPTEPEPTPTPDPIDYKVKPEVVAALGLPSAAIEQTRNFARDINTELSDMKDMCNSGRLLNYGYKNGARESLWAFGTYTSSNIDEPVEIEAKISGITGGFDVQSNLNDKLGVFGAYRNGKYDFSGKGKTYYSPDSASLEMNSYLGGLYYRYDYQSFWMYAMVYGGSTTAEVEADDGGAKFETDGLTFGAGLEMGKVFSAGYGLTIEPSLGVFYSFNDFDDTSDNVGKDYSWDSINYFEIEGGLKLEQALYNALGEGKVYVKPSVIQTMGTGSSVFVSGIGEQDAYENQTLGRIELGGRFGVAQHAAIYAWINYTFGNSYDATAVGAGLNISW